MKLHQLFFAVLLCCFCSNLAVAQPTAGMVGYFSFDNNLNNSGSATMSATSSNTTFGTNNLGAANKAIVFNGTVNSFVSFTDNGNLDFTGNFSIAFGVYMTNNTINQGFYDNCLNYGAGGVWFFYPDNTLRFNFRNASIGAVGGVPVNQWKAVCAVRNGSTISLYVDGVLAASGAEGTMAITYPYPPSLGQMFYSGTGSNGNYNPVANGSKIDEMRFYNRALSTAEIAQLVSFTLPLKMGDLFASKATDGIKLDWETLSEQNTAYFDVERSTNGTDFTPIGKVTAAGNAAGKTSYSFTDKNPNTGTNYYRLKMADIDSRFTYSRMVVIKNTSQVIAIELFPNPAVDVLQVQIPGKQKEQATTIITDAAGKVVYTKQVQLNAGNNAASISVALLPKGVYLFTFESSEGKQTKTFIKQ